MDGILSLTIIAMMAINAKYKYCLPFFYINIVFMLGSFMSSASGMEIAN